MSSRVAVVTGGGSGLGEAAAKRLASDNYALAIIDIDEAEGQRVERELTEAGHTARFIRCDVSNAAAIEAAKLLLQSHLISVLLKSLLPRRLCSRTRNACSIWIWSRMSGCGRSTTSAPFTPASPLPGK